MSLFHMTVRISNYETTSTHEASDKYFNPYPANVENMVRS